MILEINLVKIDAIYGNAGRILARRRVNLPNENAYMEAIVEFIGHNITDIAPAIGDKEFVSKLENLSSLTIQEFSDLRYVLASSYGYDIIIGIVSDMERNGEGIPDGVIEYNIIDLNDIEGGFVPHITKLIGSDQGVQISEVVEKAIDMFDLFKGSVVSGRMNDLSNDLEAMKTAEQLTGSTPAALSQHAMSILEFVGKRIYVILN